MYVKNIFEIKEAVDYQIRDSQKVLSIYLVPWFRFTSASLEYLLPTRPIRAGPIYVSRRYEQHNSTTH